MHCHRHEQVARIGSAWIGTLALVAVVAQCSSEPTRVPVPPPVLRPYGWLDGPMAGKVNGKTRAHGWGLSDQGEVTKIEILCDGTSLEVEVTHFRTRGLCTKYPGRAGCADAGFEGI